MCSSVSPSSLYLPSNTRFLTIYNNKNVSILHPSVPFILRNRNPRSPSLSASISKGEIDVSWYSPDKTDTEEDNYNGWEILQIPHSNKKKGLPTFLLVGIGASLVALLATFAHFSLSRRGGGFRFSSPLNALSGLLKPAETHDGTVGSMVDAIISETSSENVLDSADETVGIEMNDIKPREGKLGRIIIPVAVDCIQQESLLMLKKLKIIEDDVKADELCTRREYARWLVQANSLLERCPKHRIVPSAALSGSTIAAFDDISIEDPDFDSIQSLAEAGIIQSRLSSMSFISDQDDFKIQGVNFSPERFISRQDLINWKAKLNYEILPGINEEVSRSNLGFMDAKEIDPDAIVVIFMDLLAGNKSIIRKVFGHGKRFQPNKPSTKAHAAVALTSGRMRETIYSELSRLEAEYSLRKIAMKEIRGEILERGDIQRYWEEKLEREKKRGFDVERAYLSAIHDIEQEKKIKESTLSEFLKKRAAIDCQKQLLCSLKEEVHEMSERLVSERAIYMDEQRELQNTLSDFQGKNEKILDAKSILEAEIEALRILRSWIEDEAKKSQARAKVLEEAARRWKWEQQS